MSKDNREARIELVCERNCGEFWSVDGHFVADGQFELDDEEQIHCPDEDCSGVGEPSDPEIMLK